MSLFTIDAVIHVHAAADAEQLNRIEVALLAVQTAIHNLGVTMSQQLEALKTAVEENTSVDQSAITLLNGLSAQIVALKDDPVKLQALADNLKSSSATLAAAVAANTPADPNA